MKNIRYIFPATTDFRETRPTLCWEHMYGWFDGYGLLFDPVILSRTRVIPEWENGWNGVGERDDFIIACCHQASEAVGRPRYPGLYVRPAQGPAILERGRLSEKDCLGTPRGGYFYPYRLPFDRYAGAGKKWKLGENPAIARVGGSLAVGFEFFAMVNAWINDWPLRRLHECADLLHDLLIEAGAFPAGKTAEGPVDLRLDFQSYGLNRLMIQWFLVKRGESRALVAPADRALLRAVAAWTKGNFAGVKAALKQAFGALAELRRQHSQLELHFLEYPHHGLLLPDKGFFELEWPEFARQTIESYLSQVDQYGYRVSLEAGANCWRNLTRRFPALGRKLKDLWQAGKLDLTNGTQTIPFGLRSPLAFQYWQFRVGGESFREVFGRAAGTYQSQEHSLTPQMPELLLHFGYPRALHIAQNRGQAPGEDSDFIWWQSPGGHRLPAMVTRHPALSRKGNNYFFDLPLVHAEYGQHSQSLNYVNFQDMTYVPFRIHMIRAHHYAPVWGQFELSESRFTAAFDPEQAPVRTYAADAYRVSADFFYPDETNVNALSQYHTAFGLAHRLRQAQIGAWVSGEWPRKRRQLEALLPDILLTESHDVAICQGQRVGEFYAPNTMTPSPYFRDTLTDEVRKITTRVSAALPVMTGSRLFNAAEVTLPFARVTGTPRYAVGPFKPFALTKAAALPDEWTPATLPLKAGKWTLDARGRVRVRNIPVVLKDSRLGAIAPIKAAGSRRGPLCRLEVFYPFAKITVVTMDKSPFAEIGVAYAPSREFSVRDRWSDNLRLEFETGKPLDKVIRFNPNVYSETNEDRIASPYCLTAGPLTLLNEGAFAYEVDRAGGRVGWLVHVANETVYERRMALVLDDVPDPFQLARAWSQGVMPLGKVTQAWPKGDWEKLSVETLVDDRTLLVSNLAGEARTFTLAGVKRAVDVIGKNRLHRGKLMLQPYELAFIQLQGQMRHDV